MTSTIKHSIAQNILVMENVGKIILLMNLKRKVFETSLNLPIFTFINILCCALLKKF